MVLLTVFQIILLACLGLTARFSGFVSSISGTAGFGFHGWASFFLFSFTRVMSVEGVINYTLLAVCLMVSSFS